MKSRLMKGCFLLLLGFIFCKNVIASGPTPHVQAAEQANTMHTEGVVSNKQLGPTLGGSTPVTEAGYFELVGGMGIGTAVLGKSRIGITDNEIDYAAQTNSNWQFPVTRLGLGYVYFLSEGQRGYANGLVWFPSIEPMVNLYYVSLPVNGVVYRYNNTNLPTQTFSMPVTSTNVMVDVLLTIASYQRFSFFFLGGVGNAWSQISYSDSPNRNNPNARPGLNLHTNKQSNAAYEWGAGLAFVFNSHLALDFQYLYTHIGNVQTSGNGKLGNAPDYQIKPAGFGLRTEAVMLNLHLTLSK